MSDRPRVLVKEEIADSGVDLLREHFDVELGVDCDNGQLAERIGEFEGIVIRSATKLTPDLIERADRMRVIGRAGVGDLLLDEYARAVAHAGAAAGTPASRNTACAAPTPDPSSTSWPSSRSVISKPATVVRMSKAPK